MAIERFLILDDNKPNALFFEMLLRELGYEDIHISPTGEDALRIADKKHIQFVICAWEMKGMPGTLYIQKLRSKRKRKYLPCVIYSKRMGEQDVRLTKELGFQNILSMPFDRNTVRELISDIVRTEEHLDPKESTIRKMDMYLCDGKPMEAFKMISEELFEDGLYQVRAFTTAAEVHLALAKDDKAANCVEEALRIEPDNIKALQIQARIYSRAGDHETAIAILEKLCDKSPKNLTSKIKLGSAYVDADRIDEAKKVFQSVLEVDSSNQECKDQMAVSAFKQGDFSLAEQLIAETENGNELARAFNNMAITQVNRQEFEKGIASYRSALHLLTDKARIHLLEYNLGLALKKYGKLEESLINLAGSYMREPHFEKAYVAVARVVAEMKKNGLQPDKSLVAKVKSARQKTPRGNRSPISRSA